jgi:recombination protein RecT
MPTATEAKPPAPDAPPALKTKSVRERLESPEFQNAVASVLPRHCTPERFVRVAIMAATRTPKLQLCDQTSLFGALINLSMIGLEPDGRRAHLVPFWNKKRQTYECQLIVDYKGIAELVMRSGLISTIHADVVREGDIFEFETGEIKKHVPWFLRLDTAKPRHKGRIFCVYAVVRFKDGTSKADVIPTEDVEAIRKRSNSPNDGPWVTDWDEMAKKTAFRRLAKWLPWTPEVRDAIETEDEPVGETVDVPTVHFELPAPEESAQKSSDAPGPKVNLKPPEPRQSGEETAQVEGQAPPEPQAGKPVLSMLQDGLQQYLSTAEISFQTFVQWMQTKKVKGADTWAELVDVPDPAIQKLTEADLTQLKTAAELAAKVNPK